MRSGPVLGVVVPALPVHVLGRYVDDAADKIKNRDGDSRVKSSRALRPNASKVLTWPA